MYIQNRYVTCVILDSCLIYIRNNILSNICVLYTYVIDCLTGSIDYVFPRSGYIRVIFPAGITSVSLSIRVIDDEIIERIEYFNVSIVDLSLPDGVTVAGSSSVSVNILDDDSKYCYYMFADGGSVHFPYSNNK